MKRMHTTDGNIFESEKSEIDTDCLNVEISESLLMNSRAKFGSRTLPLLQCERQT